MSKPRSKTVLEEIRRSIKLFPSHKEVHEISVYPPDFLEDAPSICVRVRRSKTGPAEHWEFPFVITSGRKVK